MVPPARDPAGLPDVRAPRGRVGLRGHLRGDADQARHVPGRLGDRPALQDLPVGGWVGGWCLLGWGYGFFERCGAHAASSMSDKTKRPHG